MRNKFAAIGIEIENESPGQQRLICPQCSPYRKHKNERDLVVTYEDGVYYCHHCGWGGSVMESDYTAKITRIEKIKPQNTRWVYEYFRDRGISQVTVDKLEIQEYTNPKGEKAIAFPFFFGGVLFNYKYRTPDKRFYQTKGVEFKSFFNMDSVIGAESVIITEGEIDAASFVEAGFEHVISVPNGAPNENAKNFHKEFSYIDNSINLLKNIKEFILATDDDDNGHILKNELARRLGKLKCRFLAFPRGYKDANEVLAGSKSKNLKPLGIEALKGLIRDAVPFPVEGTFTVKDVEVSMMDLYRNGHVRGAGTGWSNLDGHYTVLPGQITVWTGVPNSGKSPFVDNLCVNLAACYEWKTVFFSPENGTVENHLTRLVRQLVGRNFFPGYENRASEAEVASALEWLNEYMFFIKPGNEEYTLDKILEGYEYFVSRYGVRNIVLDPWNTIEHQIDKNENETRYVGRILNKLKYFAQNTGTHFHLIAHPKIPDSSTMKYIPTMYSISGGANWYNVPDNGIVIHREFSKDGKRTEYNEAIVKKVKFDWVGKPGRCKFNFDVPSQRFIEFEERGCDDTF